MNVIDIVIILIMAASIIYGLYRGFLRTVLSVACCLISVILAVSFGPRLADAAQKNEGIYNSLKNVTDAVTRIGDVSLADTPVNQLSDSAVRRVIDSVNLPESIGNILENTIRREATAQQNPDPGATVNTYVERTLIGIVLNVLAFILCFAGSYIIFSILISLIHHVFKLPILKQLDWLAGGAFGFVRGWIILYVLFLIVPIISTVIPLDSFGDMLEQSTLARIFQSNGLFAWAVTGRL